MGETRGYTPESGPGGMARGGRGAREEAGRPPGWRSARAPRRSPRRRPAVGPRRRGRRRGRRPADETRPRCPSGRRCSLREGRRRSRAAARTGRAGGTPARAPRAPAAAAPTAGRRGRAPAAGARRRVGGEGRQRVVARADGARVGVGGGGARRRGRRALRRAGGGRRERRLGLVIRVVLRLGPDPGVEDAGHAAHGGRRLHELRDVTDPLPQLHLRPRNRGAGSARARG